jgi:phosphoribosylanthranilate isomerase
MVKVKVCGITNKEDFLLAERLGADYAGFIFYPGSRRCIEPEKVRAIIAGGSGRIIPVGIFVDETADSVRQVAEYTGIAIAQLHGDEQPDVCRQLPFPCWKAFRVRDDSFLVPYSKFSAIFKKKICYLRDLYCEAMLESMEAYACQAFLLDACSTVAPGGTGESFDWQWAARAIATGKNIVVAGGVSAANIDALLKLKPFAVDICSSLEIAPGKKSRAKMEYFFKKFKANARRNG